MREFKIMAMKPGNQVTVIGYFGRFDGTVNWWRRGMCSYGGSWVVSVKLADGTDREFEFGGDRPHQFFH